MSHGLYVCEVYLLLLQEQTCPNVTQMVQSFNRLALLVSSEILLEETATLRAKVIGAYILVSEWLVVHMSIEGPLCCRSANTSLRARSKLYRLTVVTAYFRRQTVLMFI